MPGCIERNVNRALVLVLGTLMTSCATGVPIEGDDVVLVPVARMTQAGDDSAEPPGQGTSPSSDGSEVGADAELPAASGQEMPNPDLGRGEQGEDEEETSSPPGDQTPREGDPEQVAPEDVPVVDTEPGSDDDDGEDPDIGQDPIIAPDPVPDVAPEGEPPASDPTDPPEPVDPTPDPLPTPVPVPPTDEHCLTGWEGSGCDTCSGQTQSDRLACRVYIDCYIASECGPASCGALDQACGINRLGNGFAAKDIADSVHACMCAP